MKLVKQTMELTEISEEDISTLRPQGMKTLVITRLRKHMMRKIYAAAEEKSKVRDYICRTNSRSRKLRAKYLDRLTREQCANLFKVRARMLPVKANYKNNHDNQTCRWCSCPKETQEHIILQCAGFKHITANLTLDSYYSDSTEDLKTAAGSVGIICQKIREYQYN